MLDPVVKIEVDPRRAAGLERQSQTPLLATSSDADKDMLGCYGITEAFVLDDFRNSPHDEKRRASKGNGVVAISRADEPDAVNDLRREFDHVSLADVYGISRA